MQLCLSSPRLGLWRGGSGGIQSPQATGLAGGRSPNVEGEHLSGVARNIVGTKHNGAPHHTRPLL